MERNTGGHGTSAIQRRLAFPDSYDEQRFFTTSDGRETLTGPSDLEATVPNEEKDHLVFEDQYWTNKPYAFVSLWRNERHEEYRYFVVEPRLSGTERTLRSFFRDKLRFAIDYDEHPTDVSRRQQEEIIGTAAVSLMDRFNLIRRSEVEGVSTGLLSRARGWLTSLIDSRKQRAGSGSVPAPDLSADVGAVSLTDRQVKKLLYYLRRDYVWYGAVDPIKRDVHVEDISCDGYDSPVFVYHTDRGGQVITNLTFGQEQIDQFVVNMAQRAGTGISRREPDVNATLPDGSRAQLTLGSEVSDHGTNFTIRQFKDVPFTPVDLLHWETFSLDQLAYMWLAIENHQSAIFAGGTASGKTTTLNAMSLFMPASEKIVSIEDTRELQIPQRNWVASKTRDAYGADDNDIDEFDLLKDALRQRPDYIIVGEVRGEEGRDLLQTMNTGHTTYTTFHAGETLEVIRRFTEEPIDASRSMFEGVDLILNQTSTTIDGTRQRRNVSIEEVGSYNARADTFSVTEAFSWDAATDTVHADHSFSSPVLSDIARQNGWSETDLRAELRRRKLLLAYLSEHGITSYAGVAATLQAYMAKPATVLSRMADDTLAERIPNLRSMRTIDIDIDEETEALVPRPTLDSASEETKAAVRTVLADGEAVLDQYRDASVSLGADLGQGEETGSDSSTPENPVDERPPPDSSDGADAGDLLEADASAATGRSADSSGEAVDEPEPDGSDGSEPTTDSEDDTDDGLDTLLR